MKFPPRYVGPGKTIVWDGLYISVLRVEPDEDPGFVWILGDTGFVNPLHPTLTPSYQTTTWHRLCHSETVEVL